MEHVLREFTAAWQRYVEIDATGREVDREIAFDALAGLIDQECRRDPETLRVLRDLATGAVGMEGPRTSSGLTLADVVRGVLSPFPDLALSDPVAFRDQVEVGFSPAQMPIAPALFLPSASDLLFIGQQEGELDGTWSWFAGRPVCAEGRSAGDGWPRRADGTPLQHIVQVALGEEGGNVGGLGALGLPESGVLQIFHDLAVTGMPGEGDLRAWEVRWLADLEDDLRERAVLLEWPDDLPSDRRIEAIPINADLHATMPSPLDVAGLDDAAFERYERVRAELEWWPSVRNQCAASTPPPVSGSPWEPGHVLVEPVSRLGGYPHGETSPDDVDTLSRELPLGPGDRHVLLADINPMSVVPEEIRARAGGRRASLPTRWFHGGRHLEVWMRASDLARQDFAHAWCLIRTDC